MGREARRREAISQTNIRIPHGSIELIDCVHRMLLIYAEAFDAVLVMKEDGDDLHPAWPQGSIVAIRATEPRPTLDDVIVAAVRRINGHFELPISDTAIIDRTLSRHALAWSRTGRVARRVPCRSQRLFPYEIW